MICSNIIKIAKVTKSTKIKEITDTVFKKKDEINGNNTSVRLYSECTLDYVLERKKDDVTESVKTMSNITLDIRSKDINEQTLQSKSISS